MARVDGVGGIPEDEAREEAFVAPTPQVSLAPSARLWDHKGGGIAKVGFVVKKESFTWADRRCAVRKEGLSKADSKVCCERMEGGQVGCREGFRGKEGFEAKRGCSSGRYKC